MAIINWWLRSVVAVYFLLIPINIAICLRFVVSRDMPQPGPTLRISTRCCHRMCLCITPNVTPRLMGKRMILVVHSSVQLLVSFAIIGKLIFGVNWIACNGIKSFVFCGAAIWRSVIERREPNGNWEFDIQIYFRSNFLALNCHFQLIKLL